MFSPATKDGVSILLERMVKTLIHMGPAVFYGGFTTFLAFVLLVFSSSYVFKTFFKVLCNVIYILLYFRRSFDDFLSLHFKLKQFKCIFEFVKTLASIIEWINIFLYFL